MKKDDYPTTITKRLEYTAGDIAILYGISHRTACKLIDSKVIPGHTLPGSKERRVTHADLMNHVRTRPYYYYVLDRIEGLTEEETWGVGTDADL